MSFGFSVIEIRSLTPENLKHVCDVAVRFGFTGICHMTTEYDKYQFIDHTTWDVPPVDDEAQNFMKNHQHEVRTASEYVHSRRLRFYMWRRELRLPVGFVAKYGEAWVDFANPDVWKLVDWNIRELFNIVPLCDGLLLSCTGEQKAGEWITANGVASELPLADCFEKMFKTVSTACTDLGKKLIIRNHGAGEPGLTLDGGEYMQAFLEAARRIGPDLHIMAKANEHDFQVTYPFNLVLSKMAQQQPTVAEFAIAMEYNGVGKFPCPNVEQLVCMMRYVRANKLKGVALRYDWHPCEHQNSLTHSVVNNMNEVNGYAFGRLLNEPGVSTEILYRDYCLERFGEQAAEAAYAIYRNLYEAGGKKQCILGHQASSTPCGDPKAPDSLFAILRCASRDRWSMLPEDYISANRALDPDETFIESVRIEKERAKELYTQALEVLHKNGGLFSSADAAMIENQLVRSLEELAIQSLYFVALFLMRRYELHDIDTCRQEATTLLDKCRTLANEYCNQYDINELDPNVGDAWLFGRRSLNSTEKVIQRLREAELWHQKYPGNTKLLQPSCLFDGAVELRSERFVLSVDPYLARICELQLDGKPIAKNVQLVEITEGGLFLTPDKLSGHLCRAAIEDGNTLLKLWCQHNDLSITVHLCDDSGTISVSYDGSFSKNANVKVLQL